MTGTQVRAATEADAPAIASVAVATGQDEEWAGSDPAYLDWLLANGRLLVAIRDGALAGFGATRRIGAGPAAVSMLCDLFVHPDAHGLGIGQAVLARLWRDEPRRMTFSSLHAHALPLYTRFGVDAWWPLLYLAGPVVRCVTSRARWAHGVMSPARWAHGARRAAGRWRRLTRRRSQRPSCAGRGWTGPRITGPGRPGRTAARLRCGAARRCWPRAPSPGWGASTASCTSRWHPG